MHTHRSAPDTSRRPRRLFGLCGSGCARAVALVALVAAAAATGLGAGRKFYDDDPVSRDDDTVEDASSVQPWVVPDEFIAYESILRDPGDQTLNVRAQNVNTVDEVPDSSWFTNRVGSRPVAPEEVACGSCDGTGPADGTWTVSEGKSEGEQPGFVITDRTGERYFIKFDPPDYPEMATGTEVVVSRLFWALGYNVPEYYLTRFRREQLVVGPDAEVQPPGANWRRMKDSDLDLLLRYTPKSADGTYRVVASQELRGKSLGPFRFHGTRPDDPNDIVPHEHRRELRGLLVFAAWLNHVSAQSSNTLDTLVREQGRTFVRHHLLDFGSTLGSGGTRPRDYWEGYDALVSPKQALAGVATFGFLIRPWRTVPVQESPALGRLPLDNGAWDPGAWQPRYPNAAFRRARPDDTFWAARKVLAVGDDLVRAAVKAGQFSDPAVEAALVQALMERRAAIGRAYLARINPIIQPALDASGVLTFDNAALEAGVLAAPPSYRAIWSRFDNATGETVRVGETTGATARMEAPAGLPSEPGVYLRIEIVPDGGPEQAPYVPVHAYFRRAADGWTLIGFERVPVG